MFTLLLFLLFLVHFLLPNTQWLRVMSYASLQWLRDALPKFLYSSCFQFLFSQAFLSPEHTMALSESSPSLQNLGDTQPMFFTCTIYILRVFNSYFPMHFFLPNPQWPHQNPSAVFKTQGMHKLSDFFSPQVSSTQPARGRNKPSSAPRLQPLLSFPRHVSSLFFFLTSPSELANRALPLSFPA